MEYSRSCKHCGIDFTAQHGKIYYCSKQCRVATELKRRAEKQKAGNLCPWCFQKPSSEGHKLCDDCRAKARNRGKARTQEQRDRNNEWRRNWVAGKPMYYRKIGQKAHHKLRMEVFEHYGMKCACCGLHDWRFLTIDHVNNDGNEHRRAEKIGTGMDSYRWLRKNGYPEGFQLLCYNCNCAKFRFGGVCPHKLDQVDTKIIAFD